MRGSRLVAFGLAGILGLGAPAAGADTGYEGDDLSVRLASAFIRFTEVSAFGGETAANRWSPAVNPASADWTAIDSRAGVVLAGYWSHIRFDNDNTIDVFGETALWDTRRAGTVHLTVSQVRSNEEEDLRGLLFDYQTDVVQVQWAKRLGSFAGGLAVNWNTSEVVQSLGGQQVYRSTADTWRFRAGMLWEPACRWLVGLVGEYATSPFDYEALVPTPGGPLLVQGDDTQEHVILRGGVSYEYAQYSTAWLDYQYAQFENDIDELTTHRFSAGVQQNLFRFLFLRAGATIDQEGNPGVMAGVGAAFSRWGTIDLGYQFGTLPELEPSFGESHVFQLVASVRF